MGRISRLQILTAILAVLSVPGISAETVHILAKGETLYSLARTYDVSLDDLLKINNINNPSGLPVGTRLVIPGSTHQAAEIHKVAKGDTYYSIARKFGMGVDTLLALNGRNSSSVLRVGEDLKVAAATVSATPSNTAGTVKAAAESRSSRPALVSDVPRWPVAGYKQPLEGKLAGVSITTEALSYVHAVAGGHVVWTGPYRGFGHVVLVDSNGYIYLYGGNEDLFVNVGQTVAAGSRIGRIGPSGPDGSKQDMIFSVFREGVPVSPDDAPRG
jgi:LysM repeat protein